MPATPFTPNTRVFEARARRIQQAGEKAAKMEWYIRSVVSKTKMTMEQRVKLATNFLRDQVVKNISTPVVKASRVSDRKVVVIERSKPGEFPRADTTRLMKDIFYVVRSGMLGSPVGTVGTTLKYGAVLELSPGLNRSFLRRTLREQLPTIKRILTGPMK